MYRLTGMVVFFLPTFGKKTEEKNLGGVDDVQYISDNSCLPKNNGGGTNWRRRFGAADSALPIRRWTTRHRAVSAPNISAPFPNFFFFWSYEEKTMKQAIS